MEPTGLLMAALIIGLLVLALGIDQATEDRLDESVAEWGSGGKAGQRCPRHRSPPCPGRD